MSRSFYSHAIFFAAFSILLSLFQFVIYFTISAKVYALQSITRWIIFAYATHFFFTVIMVLYHRAKQHTFATWACAASIAISFLQVVLFIRAIRTHELSAIFIAGNVLGMLAGMAYAVSLIIAPAGKRKLLKASGIVMFALQLLLLLSFLWALFAIGARVDGTMEKVELWMILLNAIPTSLFLLNFWQERATSPSGRETPAEDWVGFFSFVGLALIMAALFYIPKISMETISFSKTGAQIPDWVSRAAEPYEARIYIDGKGKSLPYRLLIPTDYDSSKTYPLVVCLHGSSGCGIDNHKQVLAALPAQMLSADSVRKKYPAFLLVPQCPERSTWGGVGDVASVDSLVIAAMQFVQQEFSIDTTRCYVAGNSLGGYGAWHLISTYPDLFAAAIPICGGGNPEYAAKILNIPVWAFHGAHDNNVPVSGSRDIIQAMKKLGGNPKYTEYPDAGHDINKQVMGTTGLIDWLFAQQKK